MSNEFKFADSFFHRVVQIIQEAMITGVDCADLMRQIRVTASEDDLQVLVLSPEYEKQVRAMHEKLLSQAKELQEKQAGNRFIIPDGSSSSN